MGILDDAIRQHLELKRRHGASGEDLERLEKEAFGPPTRPGDSEFEGEEGQEPEGPRAEVPTPAAEPDTGGAALDWEEDSAREHELPSAAGGGVEPESGEMTAAERARLDYAELGDTADHPTLSSPQTGEQAPESTAAETGEEEATAGEATAEPPEAAIFDQDDGGSDFDDLELDLDSGGSETAAPAREPAAGAGEDEEEDFEFDLDLSDLDEGEEEEAGFAPSEPARPGEPEDRGGDVRLPEADYDEEEESGYEDDYEEEDFEEDDVEEDDVEDEDEDLLEETPDFLQDTPEGERLWFEQGEPKDFDFDD